ncbi:hypothetical protein B0O99DRAFT_637716 [Bisporella sp. PMI_857]|nr:hypothetical protein B0O99DRAFT_637716 [Bisporella sp. PMI_857]
MPTLDDISDLGPPISDTTGRLYILFTAFAFVVVTAYTSRPLSLRFLVTGIIASDIYILLTMPNLMGHMAGFNPLIANFIVANLLRVIDLYFIRDETQLLKKKDGATPNGKRSDKENVSIQKFTKMTAFQAFDYLLINHRNIGTPYEVRNIPKFDGSNPTYVPSRGKFLVRKFLTIFVAYGLLDLLTCQPAPNPGLYSRHHEFFFTRLNDVTWEEIKCRFLTNIHSWASTYLLMQYVYAIIACVCVGSGVYAPRDFPPLIGPLTSEYKPFLAPNFPVPLSSNAKALTNLVLPPSLQSGLVYGYSMNFLAFTLSGFSHAVSPLSSKNGSQEIRGAIFFFPAQVMGIMIEDIAIAIYHRVMGKGRAGGWSKVLGFVWVGCWMSWCGPFWMYPTLRRGEEGMEA